MSSGRTYGRLTIREPRGLDASARVLEFAVQPHVALRLRRFFPAARWDRGGEVKLDATPANLVDVDWFLARYPCEVVVEGLGAAGPLFGDDGPGADGRAWIAAEAAAEQRRGEEVARVLEGATPPRAVTMALPPRDYQLRAADVFRRTGRLLVADELGIGKQQPVDAPVLTPDGWRAIGTLRICDRVIGSAGTAVRVTAVHPQGIRPSYRVRFSDGASVEAGPEHLWTVAHRRGGRTWESLVLTTDQLRLRPRLVRGPRTLDLARTTLYLPILTGPVQFAPTGTLPISPYLLGACIANGCLGYSTPQLVYGAVDWPEIAVSLAAERADLGTPRRYVNAIHVTARGLCAAIRGLGLAVGSAEKRIPRPYLAAAVADRVALLHGLMDADGSVSATGNRLTYHTISPGLAADVAELVECLGGIASARRYDRAHEGKPAEYQVRIRLPAWLAPFRVSRKARRYRPGFHAGPIRTVADVEHVREVESVCIAVDAPDALYATEHAILTHNTVTALTALADPALRPALIVVPPHLMEQWRREAARFLPDLRVHVARSARPVDVEADLMIVSYFRLRGWRDHLAGKVRAVVFDEAQELRRATSDKYAACAAVAAGATHRCGLSATPIYNYGGEFWNVFDVLAPGAFGSYDEFVRTWCVGPGDGRRDKLRDPQAFGAWLGEAGLMIRRTRKQVGRELPALTRVVEEIGHDEAVLRASEPQAIQLALAVLEKRGTPLDVLQASQELSALARLVTGLAKAGPVAEFVRMLVETTGEQVVLFGWHRACFARGTRALMLDGTTKPVETIAIGDVLIGPDSRPRLVKHLTFGRGQMFRVIPNKGEPWVCSEHHVLSVRNTNGRYEQWPAGEFARRPARWRRDRTLYRATAIDFGATAAVVEPWLMGYWLGDGAASLRDLRVSSADPEVEAEMRVIAARHGLGVSTWASPGASGRSLCKQIAFTSGRRGPKNRNALVRNFRGLGLHKAKRIHLSYATASVASRRELLAGLLDSDGHVYRGNAVGTAEYGSIDPGLAADVAFLARSLGLAATVARATRSSGYSGSTRHPMYRVTISGDLTTLPMRIARKKGYARAGQKNILHTGFAIEPAGVADFFGFEVDGDHLFLLDDFTVVHNCYDAWAERLGDARLGPIPLAWHTGTESPAKKRAELDRFLSGEARVLVMSLRSGAGVDGLQKVCCRAVIGELDWSPGVLEQCLGRVHRDGQAEPVLAYYLLAQDGADPVMADVLGVKRGQIEGVREPFGAREAALEGDPDHVRKLAAAWVNRAREGAARA